LNSIFNEFSTFVSALAGRFFVPFFGILTSFSRRFAAIEDICENADIRLALDDRTKRCGLVRIRAGVAWRDIRQLGKP